MATCFLLNPLGETGTLIALAPWKTGRRQLHFSLLSAEDEEKQIIEKPYWKINPPWPLGWLNHTLSVDVSVVTVCAISKNNRDLVWPLSCLSRSQVSDCQCSDEELWDHLLQWRFLPDVRLHPGRDHAAALYLPVLGWSWHHEERPGPVSAGPAWVRGAQSGHPLLLQGRWGTGNKKGMNWVRRRPQKSKQS